MLWRPENEKTRKTNSSVDLSYASSKYKSGKTCNKETHVFIVLLLDCITIRELSSS